jgi:hyperosmotically inducible protein
VIGRRVAAVLLATVAIVASGCADGPGSRTDEQIKQDVATALYAGNIEGVTVAVSGGAVTLSGAVADQATADRAAELARAVEGVTSVTSSLTFGAAGPTPVPDGPAVLPPDSQAAGRIQQRLIADTSLAGSKITPAVAGGVATLTGTVPSEQAKATAERIAKSVDGVTSVSNQLQVVAAVQPVARTDEEVENDVNALVDSKFAALSLFVQVESGVVKLAGAVPNQATILQVSKAVSEVSGVKAVDTARLTIQGGEPEGQKLGAPSGT